MERTSDDARGLAAPATDDGDVETEIRRRAYERYLARDGGPGDAVDDWCCAEREVREQRAQREPRAQPEAAAVAAESPAESLMETPMETPAEPPIETAGRGRTPRRTGRSKR